MRLKTFFFSSFSFILIWYVSERVSLGLGCWAEAPSEIKVIAVVVEVWMKSRETSWGDFLSFFPFQIEKLLLRIELQIVAFCGATSLCCLNAKMYLELILCVMQNLRVVISLLVRSSTSSWKLKHEIPAREKFILQIAMDGMEKCKIVKLLLNCDGQMII